MNSPHILSLTTVYHKPYTSFHIHQDFIFIPNNDNLVSATTISNFNHNFNSKHEGEQQPSPNIREITDQIYSVDTREE